MEEKRESKKIRLITDPPAIQNGVLSASRTPISDVGRSVELCFVNANIESFFNDDFTGIPEYEIAPYVKNILKSKGASEESLRDAVFTDLQENHGIKFPKSSSTTGLSQILQKALMPNIKKYQESHLASLLEEFHKTNERENVGVMHRIMKGLPVTTTSKPDLVALVSRGNGSELRMGEFKNATTYDMLAARTQCTMYLLGLLYFLRAKLGQPVESVYGFFLCGRRCQDQDGDYTVGLVMLSAPQSLGKHLEARFTRVTADVDEMRPLNLLIHFLKTGKAQNVAEQPRLEVSRRVPSLFTLPTSLWTDQDERKLVLHATLSIVFYLSGHALKRLLLDKATPHFKNMLSHKDQTEWDNYSQCLKTKLDSLSLETFYFLKIRSKDTCLQNHPMGAMLDVWDAVTRDKSIAETYLLPPFVTMRQGLVVMHDRGSPLEGALSSSTGSHIFVEFKKVMNTAMFLSENLPHGDVLPHNLVYDIGKKSLSLIDVDEGVLKDLGDDHLPLRNNVYSGDDKQDWYLALSYPNIVRTHAKLYTQSQLIASFLFVLTKLNGLSDEVTEAFERLQKSATALGMYFLTLDKKNKKQWLKDSHKAWIMTNIQQSYKIMEEILGLYDSAA
jgi:hypothetical protein